MPILTRNKPRPAQAQCVREVRVEIPLERLGEIKVFYTLTLGLLPWPEEHQIPGGWGVGDPQCGLYLQFRHDPEVDPLRRRMTLSVDALKTLEEQLIEQDWGYRRVRGFGWTDEYLLLHDPVGHLIEVRQSQPL